MAKGYFKVTIQTKPYLKKYLQKLYGNPLTFSTDNHFGICISAFLFRPVKSTADAHGLAIKSHDSKQSLRMRVDRFDSTLEIHLPKTFLTQRRGGFEITDQHTIILNKLFESKFDEELWKLCTIMSLMGVQTKDALEEICGSYNISIDDDITMDCLAKKEYRFRKKMQLSAPDLSSESVKNSVKRVVLSNLFAARA